MTDNKDNFIDSDRGSINRIADPILTSGIGSRINDAAKRVGGTRKLAELIDISEAQLYRITSEKSQPKIETVAAIAKACGVSLGWLATGETEFQREMKGKWGDGPPRTRLAEADYILSAAGALKGLGLQAIVDDFAAIPVYDVRASAGHGATLDDEKVVSQIAFRRDWLSKEGLKAKGLAAITADGDSMEPTVPDGSLLLVDTEDDYPRDGIYVLRLDGSLVVKRIQRLQDGAVRVKSDNQAYDPIDIRLGEFIEPTFQESFRIIGRVVWIGRRV